VDGAMTLHDGSANLNPKIPRNQNPFTNYLRFYENDELSNCLPSNYLLIIILYISTSSLSSAQDKATQIDAFVSEFYNARQFNGSVLVAEQGKVIYKKGSGGSSMMNM
jgi:hypothetical protein